ncbi:SF1B family DNA helicase RecD2 [Periweissella fabalis]|uniref:ATP-dependent RecD2 DNA helicase n=1 Tax=Periweissella fabalis TaxID=1070421 RepID=A0A7X6N2Y7_9LACO|nr:ATP-dependent RecD-like DNA helicase [Periweissella fabalis]MCM0599478.1 ATP-dependent RecD-like DNA helicase [Periweissella fabalis]NKZ23757.1 ATP-dependent RecD-like DNA helicase [Periweissella fabalis]
MNDELSLFEDQTEQPYLLGKVTTIFFAAADSFYKVVLLKVLENNFDWAEPEIVATGSFGELREENTYRFFGKIVQHAKYGQQFQVTNYQSEGPTTESGLINYLASDSFTGIGEKTAERIVDLLGLDAINQILVDPSRLAPLNLKEAVITNLVEQLKLNNGMEQVVIGLNQYGFGSTLATAIYQKYQNEALEVIHRNPYQLVEDIDGISFKRADQVARVIGIKMDSTIRIEAGILATLDQQSFNSGDVYSDVNDVLQGARQLLSVGVQVEITLSQVQEALLKLVTSQRVVADGEKVYLASLYLAEWQSATQLVQTSCQKNLITYSNERILATIKKVEKMFKIKYDDLQKQAIIDGINAPVFVLTGGPGTGKTTIVNGLVATFALLHEVDLDVNAYKEDNFPILLAAPTGRAAKRMTETTGLPAKTIHRLLGLTGRERNEAPDVEELKGLLLIVDEMSMVDILLFNTLMSAVPTKMQIIFVGDKDQLPSVGPGQVFADLLASNTFKQVELTHIYRQANESSIIPLAHAIKDGDLPDNLTINQSDRTFIAAHANQIPSVIEKVVQRAQQKGFAFNDMQVLAPMYRGLAGIDNLNQVMQDILNPLNAKKTREVEFNQQKFRVGDKVLHLVNSPESNVFNGDIGQIVGLTLKTDKGNVEKVDQLTIAFDAGEITYPRSEWKRLTLAYATSIHKAQGSEFKLVIMPMVQQYSVMLQRNLIYTGITRASEMLILIGEPDAFKRGVNNVGAHRASTLQQRIQQVLSGEESVIIKNDTEELIKAKALINSKSELNPDKTKANQQAKPLSTSSINEQMAANTSLDLFDEVSSYQALNTNKDKGLLTGKLAEPTVVFGTILTDDMILNNEIDPMIGMENVSPYDFVEKVD